MIEHGKIYVCAGCRIPAPLMFRIGGDRSLCPDCVKTRIAELEAVERCSTERERLLRQARTQARDRRHERDEARAKLASAQHDVEVYRDAVIEAREHGRVLAKDRDCASAGEDLLYIFEDLHGLPGGGEGS